MATLEENINQAISDFNDIELALEEQGVNVPSGTDTSEYGNLVRSISNNGTVDQTYNPTSVNAQSGIAVAEAMSELPITLVESPDTNGNILDIYSMDSGTYIFSGKFTPYPEASTTFSFSSGQLVTIRHGSISTVAQVFYPPNNAIQYLDIRPDETSETGYTYTRQDAKLVNMESITNRVTTLGEDCDDEHYPTAKAVYDQLNELNKIATTDIDGLLSASDKSKLDGIEEGANKTIVDSELSDTSTNPVQNNVLTNKFENIKELKTPKESVTYNSYTAPYCQSGIVTDSLAELYKYRTTIGTATVSGEWNNIISVRHRNGGIAGDGQSYGMYLRAPMTYESNLIWRQQFSASWKAEKTLLDSSNFTNYIPYETGTCTLSASNGTVSNATYSVVGNMVTLNFNIAPTGAGNVVVSGLPFTATKNQSGFASSTATYNITANQTSVSINSTSGTAEYCTVTYLK